MKLIIAEKPSVAKTYAAALGAMTVRFTVSQTDEGLYRVETIEIR